MRLAFGIVTLMPWGGLQRDCIRLARAAQAGGHKVTIFTARKQAEVPADLKVRILPSGAFTNAQRNYLFGKALRRATSGHFDRVVGFDKIQGLDILYCGDMSFAESHREFWGPLNPRHRRMKYLEGACFAPTSKTQIMALSLPQMLGYQSVWHTQSDRMVLLPPPADPSRRQPQLRSDGTRERTRSALGLSADDLTMLCIGAGSYGKGFDRVIEGLDRIDRAKLIIAGVGTDDGALSKMLASRKHRHLKGRVSLLGPRDDIEDLIAAADLLLHPARAETTGTVILEALVNGLPVIATSVCGFANHIDAANAGVVLPEPFGSDDLVQAIGRSTPTQRQIWSDNAIAYGKTANLYSGLDTALSIITDPPKLRTRPSKSANLISVIVTTYNRPDALEAVLRALDRQSDRDFEVIVADDGSTSATADLLNAWLDRLPQQVTHVWQEHRGFRAAEIRNRAILASRGDYCVFLDGDCIPRSDFVLEHRRLAEHGWLVVGNRVLMSERMTHRVLRDRLEPEQWTFGEAMLARFHGDINRIAPLMQATLGPVRKIRPNYWWGARSCNLAIWRSDLDRVDGFDNSYVGWGLEDSDLLVRLLRAGVQRKDGRFSTGVFHLWHPLADPSTLSANQTLLQSVQRNDRIRAPLGLSSMQNTPATPPAWSDDNRTQARAAMV